MEVNGLVEFDRSFTRFVTGLTNQRQIWEDLIPEVQSILADQFKAEGQGRSGKWKPLSLGYAAIKLKQYPGKTILRRTDRLINSLTGRTADTILNIGNSSLEYGTKVFYASFHQTGTRRMSARRIFDFDEPQRVRFQRSIHRSLVSMAQSSFPGETVNSNISAP